MSIDRHEVESPAENDQGGQTLVLGLHTASLCEKQGHEMASEGNEHTLDRVVGVKPQARWRAIAPGSSSKEGGTPGED